MSVAILNVTNLSQRFGSEEIFSSVTFQVAERERIALVGTNGSGKSSLLKIIAGIEQPESGTVDYLTGLRVAYQSQEARFVSERSVYEEALEAFRDVREVGHRLSHLEQEMASASENHMEQLFEEYSRLSAEFEARHGYEMEHRTAQVLSGLGFPEDTFGEPVAQLSGGQKTRVSLAKTLLSDPDLLLLDEPTNHLDLRSIEWLEGFLASWNRAVVVVSHDRYFLDKVTERTLEMAFGRLEDYPASYSRFVQLREERRERQRKEYEAQQEYIARTEEFIRKYKAGQRSREARGRETRLGRLERIPAPQEHLRLNVSLHAGQRSGQIVLSTTPLRIGYHNPDGSETQLAESGELIIERADRVAIVGPNGSGKTTALRTIVGEIKALSGSVEFGTNVKPAYYAQAHEGLDPSRSALETILRDRPIGEEQARSLLGRFLFSNDDVFKPVAALSGGERSRLALARLSLEDANLLILDEPTNHLDILSRESLETVLHNYDGTILFVSHDRFFIDRIATKIWAIEEGRIVTYLGNYSEMLDHRARVAATLDAPPPSPLVRPEKPKSTTRESSPRNARRNVDRQLRQARKCVADAERRVGKLEESVNRITDQIAEATAEEDTERIAELGVEYERLQADLSAAYAAWTEAGSELDALLAETATLSED